MTPIKILLAGGGTGGHLFPALAIAGEITRRMKSKADVDIRFVGTKKGLEYRIKNKLGYPLSLINVRGLARSGLTRNLLFPILLVTAIIKSIFIIHRFRPDMVIGTGGYVMGPVLLAAILLNRRCVIQEQNSYPGLTTRKLAGKVDKLYLGFDTARKYLDKLAETVCTGNPVKATIGTVPRLEARHHYGFTENDKVLLVLGGSQGAASINQNILDNFKTIPAGYYLIWQTGESNYGEITAALKDKIGRHVIFAFTDEIERAYAAADMAITRAGALTMAELEAAALPSILIPYPHAAEDHQRRNAEYFMDNNAAHVVDNSLLMEYNIPAMAIDMIESGKCREMSDALKRMKKNKSKPAVELIVDDIFNLMGMERK